MVIPQRLILFVIVLSLVLFDGIFLLLNSGSLLTSIYAFLFLLLVPGFILLRIFHPLSKITGVSICYVVGLSTASLILMGLIANYIMPYLLPINPLDRTALILIINVTTIAFLIIGDTIAHFTKQNENIKIAFSVKLFDIPFFAIPSLFPILALIGVALLNNGGSNWLLLVNLLLIPIYVFVLCIRSNQVHQSVFPISLFLISISILLQSSMRGWNVSGTDILREFRMFNLTYTSGYWAPDLIKHSYNACLSITILPTFLARFIDGDIQYIFKFFIQIIFGFVPVAIYYFTANITNRVYAYLTAFFYISFPIFVISMSMHVRQEVAFLFFSLMFLTIFDRSLTHFKSNILASIFGLCMIFSHYSTTYLALYIFGFWYLLNFVLRILVINQWIKKRLDRNSVSLFVLSKLSIFTVIFLFVAAFIWYTQVVKIGGDLVNFGNKVTSNLSQIFNNDLRPDQTSLANQFNLFYRPANKEAILNSFFINSNKMPLREIPQHFYPKTAYKEFYPILKDEVKLKPNVPGFVYPVFNIGVELIKKGQKLLLISGVLFLVFQFLRGKKIDADYVIASLGSLSLITLFVVLPFFSIEYDLMRASQQLLIILGFTSLFALNLLFKKAGWSKLAIPFAASILIMYFGINTSIFYQILGNYSPSHLLNNSGTGYERLIVNDAEIASAKWLERKMKKGFIVQSDPDAQGRIFMSVVSPISILANIMPGATYRSSYIYLNAVNIKEGVMNISYQGESLRVTIPQTFIEDNKSLIYSNGLSKIYR